MQSSFLQKHQTTEWINRFSFFLDVLLCNVQSVMVCFEGFEFKAANVCL